MLSPVLLALSMMLPMFRVEAAPPQNPDRDRGRHRINRERWKKLDSKKKREIQRLFQELRRLEPEQRNQLLERLRSLPSEKRRQAIRRARQRLPGSPEERHAHRLRRQMHRRVLNELSPTERDEMRRLPPVERRKYLQKRFRDRRDRLITRLPADVREKVHSLPPREQARLIRQHWALEAASRTFQDPRELERLRAMPRRRVVRALLRQPRNGAAVTRPDFLSEATWKRWRKLQPYEKQRVLRHLFGTPHAGPRRPIPPRGRPVRPGDFRRRPPPGPRPGDERRQDGRGSRQQRLDKRRPKKQGL